MKNFKCNIEFEQVEYNYREKNQKFFLEFETTSNKKINYTGEELSGKLLKMCHSFQTIVWFAFSHLDFISNFIIDRNHKKTKI